MDYSRRDIAMMIGAAAAIPAGAQSTSNVLPSKVFVFEDIPVRNSGPEGQNKSRKVMEGSTHGGFYIESHITQLAPGLSPHPPHRHVHEEILMLREGTLDVYINGKTTRATAGSVCYMGSNEEHSVKNVGTTPAMYFIVELREKGPSQQGPSGTGPRSES